MNFLSYNSRRISPNRLAAFPYVNGGLFEDEKIEIPNFTDEILDLLLQHASEAGLGRSCATRKSQLYYGESAVCWFELGMSSKER